MKKSVKIVLATAIALPIVVAAAIPLFVNANTFRPTIEKRLSAALSRKVTLGDLSLSLTKGRLEANDLAIAEDPKFGQTPFFTAKRLHIGVQMKPLILHHELQIRSFEVDAPQIHLIRAEDGTWNFSTLSHGTDSLNTTRPTALPDLPVDQITIKDGNAKVETLPLQKNPQVYDHLDVKLEHFSLTQAFPFTVSASLPADGKVEVSGTLGPINPQDAASTSFDTQVKIQHLDPVAAGYVEQAAGISMIGGLDAHVVSDGADVTSDGKVHAERLILLKGGKAAPYPLDVSYQVVHSLKSNSGKVSDLVFQTGAIAIHIKGNYQLTANIPVLDLKLLAQSVPIDDLQAGVRWADIISCATLATAPLVSGAWLSPGQHLDLIGSFTPKMREVDDEALARSRIYVDTREGALAESGELVQALAAGVITAADIHGDLAALTRGTISGRDSADEITLFKSVGCAIEDLAAAQLALGLDSRA